MHRDLPHGRASDVVSLSPQAVAAAAGALVAITDAHSLTQTQHERLESAYGAIASHMAEHHQFRHLTIEVHPQGSMLIGTITRPEGRAEFDVDLVLSLVEGLHNRVDCDALLDAAYRALHEHAECHDLKIARKRRCIQLQYVNEMHADVTPVIHHPRPFGLYGDTFGLVPDRDLERYLGTNPKGYGRWFDASAVIMPVFRLRRELEVTAKADVVPLPSLAVFDRLLSRIVQLFKIHRNVFFAEDLDLCPPSVFITTLIVQAYRDATGLVFTSPLDLLLNIWRDMPRYIRRQSSGLGREVWIVDNPTAPGDNLADRMNSTPERQRAFAIWHAQFHEDLLDLIAQADSKDGIDALSKRVSSVYGSIAGRAINAAALAATQTQRAARQVSVPTRTSMASSLATASAIKLSSQPHRFFGR